MEGDRLRRKENLIPGWIVTMMMIIELGDNIDINKLRGLWNPEVQCRFHKGSPIIPILSRINSVPRIDTYFFKVHSISSHLRLVLPNGIFLVGLPIKILKEFLHSSILATWPAHLNLLDLITLTTLGEWYKYKVPHCGSFSSPHSHPSWAQIFASRSCFQIPLACIFSLM